MSRPRRHLRPTARLLAVLTLASALVSLPGCNVVRFFASGFTRESKPAACELPDKPTLVLVDDPANTLGDAALPGDIAARVGFNLTKAKALSKVIDPARVADLAALDQGRFNEMPVDEIGRTLGAQQVVYIAVQSAAINREANMLRPVAGLLVKVVDATTGKRLFPPLEGAGATPTSSRGFPVNIRMSHTIPSDDSTNPTVLISKMRTALAARIADEASNVFLEQRQRVVGDTQ